MFKNNLVYLIYRTYGKDTMMYLLLLLLGIAAVTAELALLYAWISARYHYAAKTTSTYTPKAQVIIPCKNIGKDLIENTAAILNQHYPNYNVTFITDSAEDPAYQLLNKKYNQHPQVTLMISKIRPHCSGKISALITGIHAAQSTEVYVFADADIKPHPNWLSLLIAHLDDNKVGATTGYRWYFPYDLNSLVVSCWNMIQSISLYYPSYNYAWGGSTAITKQMFHRLHIERAWKHGLSDDLILTKLVKQAGYNVQFIPACIAESPVEGTLKEFITWGTRQLTWTKWYYPQGWIISTLGSIGLKIVTLTGIIALLSGYILPGSIMISTVFIEMLTGGIAHTTIRNHMQYPKQRFKASWHYSLILPLVFFIIAYNDLMSIFTRKITWGGRTYRKKDVIQ